MGVYENTNRPQGWRKFKEKPISISKTNNNCTHCGETYSVVSWRLSSYPNFLSTVHVVSCRPFWMNSVCRNKKPENNINVIYKWKEHPLKLIKLINILQLHLILFNTNPFITFLLLMCTDSKSKIFLLFILYYILWL